MDESCEINGKIMENLGKFSGNHEKITEKSWNFQRKIIGKS